MSAWKTIVPDLKFIPPKCLEDLHNCSFWFCPKATLIGPGFSKLRALILHKAGLKIYRDAMEGDQFIVAESAQDRFGLKVEEARSWNVAIQQIKHHW